MKILILGSSGQIGSELQSSIIDFSQSYLPNSNDLNISDLNKKDMNFLDFEKLQKTLEDFSPHVVINAAAFTDVDFAEDQEEEAFKMNSEFPGRLGELCSKVGSILIHFSTDYVFNGKLSRPYQEEDNVDPIGVYGRSKLEGEEKIRNSCKKYIIIRTAWVFGKKGKNFVKTMIKLGNIHDEVSVVADQIGSPTSAVSISNAVAKIIFEMQNASSNDRRWGTYHFSGLPYVSWADFASEIFEQAFKKGVIEDITNVIRISSNDFETKAKRPNNSRLNCKKIELNFGIDSDDWKKSLDILLNLLVKKNG